MIYLSVLYSLEPRLILKMQKNMSQIIEQSKKLYLDTGEWRLLDILVEEGSLNGYSKLTFQVQMLSTTPWVPEYA